MSQTVANELLIKEIWDILQEVSDPEIPVLSVIDLGIIRDVRLSNLQLPEVIITPTYSGCPAMNMIEVNIRAVLQAHGYDSVKVTTVLSPAWTTDWMSKEGRKKLKAYGIAPPEPGNIDKMALFQDEKQVSCPRCESRNTKMIAQFGSTACKSLYKCEDCLEPFDYFKCH